MYSTPFESAFHRLMKYEGGYSNDAADRGGETRWGISRRQYPGEDIPNLTMQQAKAIFYRDYWQLLGLDGVRHPGVAAEIFEQAVNFGPERAVMNAQTALCFLRVAVDIDGRLGPKTKAALNGFTDAGLLICALNGEQYCRYKHLIENDPSQKAFARGWLRRIQF